MQINTFDNYLTCTLSLCNDTFSISSSTYPWLCTCSSLSEFSQHCRMEPGGCICGWRPAHHVRNTSRAMVNHMADCKYRQQKAEERRANQKRHISDTDLGDHGGSASEHTQKTPRLAQVGVGIETALRSEEGSMFQKG